MLTALPAPSPSVLASPCYLPKTFIILELIYNKGLSNSNFIPRVCSHNKKRKETQRKERKRNGKEVHCFKLLSSESSKRDTTIYTRFLKTFLFTMFKFFSLHTHGIHIIYTHTLFPWLVGSHCNIFRENIKPMMRTF
jgi:hypothetical protein